MPEHITNRLALTGIGIVNKEREIYFVFPYFIINVVALSHQNAAETFNKSVVLWNNVQKIWLVLNINGNDFRKEKYRLEGYYKVRYATCYEHSCSAVALNLIKMCY